MTVSCLLAIIQTLLQHGFMAPVNVLEKHAIDFLQADQDVATIARGSKHLIMIVELCKCLVDVVGIHLRTVTAD